MLMVGRQRNHCAAVAEAPRYKAAMEQARPCATHAPKKEEGTPPNAPWFWCSRMRLLPIVPAASKQQTHVRKIVAPLDERRH